MIEIALPIAPLWWIAAPIVAVLIVAFLIWLERKEFTFDASWFVLYGAVVTVVTFIASLIGVMVIAAINDTSKPELMREAINSRGVLVAQGDKLPAFHEDDTKLDNPVHIRDTPGQIRECYTMIWKDDANGSAKAFLTMAHPPKVSFEVLCKKLANDSTDARTKLVPLFSDTK